MSLDDHTRVIASPIATSPTRALIEKFDVVLQRSLDLALRIVLDPCLPSVRHQPPSDKVIIVGVELVLTPSLSLEAIQEQGALENLGSEGTGASGHA